MSFYVSTATFFLFHCDEWDRVVALPRHKFVTGATLLQLLLHLSEAGGNLNFRTDIGRKFYRKIFCEIGTTLKIGRKYDLRLTTFCKIDPSSLLRRLIFKKNKKRNKSLIYNR